MNTLSDHYILNTDMYTYIPMVAISALANETELYKIIFHNRYAFIAKEHMLTSQKE